jgi:hypothetical protein
LKELLAAQQNAASPLYHHWLTPEAFAPRFGVADEDIAASETWLSSRGFHIENVAGSRDRITFSGSAADHGDAECRLQRQSCLVLGLLRRLPTLTACYDILSLPVSNVSTTQLTIGIGAACNSPLPNERGA